MTGLFPDRSALRSEILSLLQSGPRSSREIEELLAERFGITEQQRAIKLEGGNPAWRNHVSWVLVDLGHTRAGEIERIADKRAPDGGSMGIYRLVAQRDPAQS
jgi:hypothetical protein